jgi:hypothetical protein
VDYAQPMKEQNHQWIGNELIDGVPSGQTGGVVGCRQRLGGFLRYYYRAA